MVSPGSVTLSRDLRVLICAGVNYSQVITLKSGGIKIHDTVSSKNVFRSNVTHKATQPQLPVTKYRAQRKSCGSRTEWRRKHDNRRIPNYDSSKNRNNNVRVSHDRADNPPLAYYILMTDRAASSVTKGYDTRVKFGRGPERDRPSGRTTERSEKGPDRSGTGGFSLNYRTYATSARVNHSTMPSDGRSSGSPLFPPSPSLLQSFVPVSPRALGPSTKAGRQRGNATTHLFLRHRRMREGVKYIA